MVEHRADNAVVPGSSPGAPTKVNKEVKLSKYQTGDKIVVRVEGREYETYIDEHGTQRFPSGYAATLFEAGILDLNRVAILFHSKKGMTLDEYIQLNMDLGYSVSGFCDVIGTHEMNTGYCVEVFNPLWED